MLWMMRNKIRNNRLMRKHIFYKVIDDKEVNNEKIYFLQCLNSSNIFSCDALELYCDKTIINHIHPMQACFISFDYHLKNEVMHDKIILKNRYGLYGVKEIIRRDSISYINYETGEENIENVLDIIYNEDLICGFDATHAAYIGKIAGLILKRKGKKGQTVNSFRLIVGGKQ